MTSIQDAHASKGFGRKSRMTLLGYARQLIRENRRAFPCRFVAAAAEKYLHAYYNENFWEFELNGERFAAQTFGTWLHDRKPVIWDVGANSGQWALEALGVMPNAEIHCFEIIPSINDDLVANTKHLSNIKAHGLGLSDKPGEITVHLNPADTVTSSVAPRLGARWFPVETVPVRCQVTTADELSGRLAPPQFLKIDVEGHEVSVLKGAQALMAGTDAPSMIQIEYGDTYIPTGCTLRDIYQLLEPYGYFIGRLFPNHVDFKPYAYEDDTFRLGNLIAAKDPDLRRMLTRKPA